MKKYTLMALLLGLVLLLMGCTGTAPEEDPAGPAEPGEQEETVTVALTYSGGSTTLRLELDRETGLWHWGDDPDFPLQQDFARELVELVDSIPTMSPIPGAVELSDYRLDDPNRTLVVTDSRGETLTYYLGKWTDDGVYLYQEGTSGLIYAVKGLRNRLDSRIFDRMELPQLPQLTAESILSVELEGSAGRIVLTPAEGRWLSEGRDVTEQVAEFTDWLESMELKACLDWRPSSGVAALCGLDEPVATLTVRYAPAGVERSFTLTMGWLREDEGRCVTLEEDDTIYLMDAAPLSRLARRGLE